MKKFYTLLLLAVCFGNYCSAQNPSLQYVKSIGSSGTDDIQSMSMDAHCNFICKSKLSDVADIDPGPNTVMVASGFYVVKYDSSGNLIWYLNVGTTEFATDNSGNVYILGIYDSTFDFDPGPGIKKISSPFQDLCLAKYSTDKNLVWVDDLKSSTANTVTVTNGFAVDNNGSCYITGILGGEIDLDPSANKVLIQGNGIDNYFVAAYKANGDYKWSFKLGVNNPYVGTAIISTGKNGVYLSGGITLGSTDLDPGPGTFTVNGNSAGGNGFIAKYNNNDGSFIWGLGLSSDTSGNGLDMVNEDSLGDLVLTGSNTAPLDIDPGPGVTIIPGNSFFLVKYSSTGTFIWGKQETDFYGYDFYPFSITIDPQNNILQPGAHYSADSFNIAVAKYNSNGTKAWYFALDHKGGHDAANYGLVTDKAGGFYIAGEFDGKVDFDPNTGVHNVKSNGLQDAFFAKYKDNSSTLPVSLINFSGEVNGKQNLLHWATATEQNNTGFEVQRSNDGFNFSKIGFINSKATNGYSNIQLSYDFADITFSLEANYYRLKQIDKDGKFTYSNIVVLRDDAISNQINVYPNPVKDLINVKINSANNAKIILNITDNSGKVFLTKSTNVSTGETIIQLNISQLAAGSYFIKILSVDGSEKAQKKFIKQ